MTRILATAALTLSLLAPLAVPTVAAAQDNSGELITIKSDRQTQPTLLQVLFGAPKR